jgi:hypothetical protein
LVLARWVGAVPLPPGAGSCPQTPEMRASGKPRAERAGGAGWDGALVFGAPASGGAGRVLLR